MVEGVNCRDIPYLSFYTRMDLLPHMQGRPLMVLGKPPCIAKATKLLFMDRRHLCTKVRSLRSQFLFLYLPLFSQSSLTFMHSYFSGQPDTSLQQYDSVTRWFSYSWTEWSLGSHCYKHTCPPGQ